MLHGYIFYFLGTLLIGVGSLGITALTYTRIKTDWMPYYLYFYTALTVLVGLDFGLYYLAANMSTVNPSLVISLNYFETCVVVPLLTFILPVFVFVLCGLSVSHWRVKLVGIVVGSEALLQHVLIFALGEWGWGEFLSDLAIFGMIGYSVLVGLRTYRTLQNPDRQRLAGRVLLLLGAEAVFQFMDILSAYFFSLLRLYPLVYCVLGVTVARYGSRVLLAASDPQALHRIMRHIPEKKNMVFKLVDAMTKRAVLHAFPSKRMVSFVSYTTHDQEFRPHPSVVISRVLNEHVLPFYQENGYKHAEMEQFFAQGAISFTIYDDKKPLATCFTFRNYEEIWEIGGVYTAPSQRRKGFARMVVETALHTLLSQQSIPRYQVSETNIPSLRLAERLGLKKFVVTEHFFYTSV